MSKLPQNQRVMIESIKPSVDDGRYPVKIEENAKFEVLADIFRDGHDKACAWLLHRKTGARKWGRVAMKCINPGLDLWTGSFNVGEPGNYEYYVEAFCDLYTSWAGDTKKKIADGQNVSLDLQEGLGLIRDSEEWLPKTEKHFGLDIISQFESAVGLDEKANTLLNDETIAFFAAHPNPKFKVISDRVYPLRVDRKKARFAAWYECFPRSCGTRETVSGTFKDVENRLPEVKAMGFDVLYFPPIHPIGFTKRKGPNNSLTCTSSAPGCPYSIGNQHGGHDAIEPSLGTFDDFAHLVEKCAEFGIEIAIDFAINCSPDHPYLKDHPEWFSHRPDGSIKFAENPPKKYEDIYPLDFDSETRDETWREMKRIILFWAEKGVRIFRVDNPHTKPFNFWEWLIKEVQMQFSDVLFLAEAFTRPRVMHALAKLGFSQSYSYFTWRNEKQEIQEYFTELTTPPASYYMRANLFTNTPDILPTFLQEGGRPAFQIRAVLAATLSTVYGIYSGFELCENTPIPGREEYLNSEKYQFKVWDWNRPGNIKSTISRLNRIRRENEALQGYDNLTFLKADNENILFYEKKKGREIILIVVNLDPHQKQHSFVHVPLGRYGIGWNDPYKAVDLLNEKTYFWKGERNYVELDPSLVPAHIFKIEVI